MSARAMGSVRERLAAEPGRGLGDAAVLAAEASTDAAVLQGLVRALRDPRPVVVGRAANALKKVQKESPKALDGFAGELVRVALGCSVPEARWNLWLVLGGLRLTGRRRALAVDALFAALRSASALERVGAMQALVDLSVADPGLRARVQGVVERALEDASAAVRARARRLWGRDAEGTRSSHPKW